MPTPEETNRAISDAIEAHLNNLPDSDQGVDIGVLGDWIGVVSMVSVNDQGQPVATYYVLMKGETMLPHVANGLLTRGIDEIDRLEMDT